MRSSRGYSKGNISRRTAIAMLLPLAGCCAPHPSLNAVRSRAQDDLPVGTSHEDVLRFCSAHGFSFFENDPHAATATRPAGGCEWNKAMIWMNIAFDDDRRVTSVHVWGGTLER